MGLPNKTSEGPPFPVLVRLLATILHFIFKLLYHQFAWTYDWVAGLVSVGRWQVWVKSTLPYLNGPRILEIGYGPGHLLAELSQKKLSIFGIDESWQMACMAQKRIIKSGFTPYILRGKAQYLPFPDELFDQVVLTFPAEFIFNQMTLTEIHRILIPGGMGIIVPTAWITGHKPRERAAAWLNHITGEAPEWNKMGLEPLKSLGFDVDWEIVDMPSSKLLLIRLIKTK